MKVISRKEAIKQGLKRYFTGKPCKHGHVSDRVIYGGCRECKRIRELGRDYDKNLIVQQRKRQISKHWYASHAVQHIVNSRQWYADNKAKKALTVEIWEMNNPEKRAMYGANRTRALSVSTPGWANHNIIKEIYLTRDDLTLLTKLAGGVEPFHVDHIIPLQHPRVCGLHCEDNLQLLSQTDNLHKNNTFII